MTVSRESILFELAECGGDPAAWLDGKLSAMSPGERMVYWVGFLARDRRKYEEAGAIADAVLVAGVGEMTYGIGEHDVCVVVGSGLGYLSQRRIDDGLYEYTITKAKVPYGRRGADVGIIHRRG